MEYNVDSSDIKYYMAWSNFRTGKTDWLTEAPADYSDYMPQIAPAKNMYTLLIEMGKSPQEAFIQVMEAYLGK